MTSKSEKKKEMTIKAPTQNCKPITMDTDSNMHKPVRGLPNK